MVKYCFNLIIFKYQYSTSCNQKKTTSAVFHLDFEIFRTIARFIQIPSGHSLVILNTNFNKGLQEK